MRFDRPESWPGFSLCQEIRKLPTAGSSSPLFWERKLDGVRVMASSKHLALRNSRHRNSGLKLWNGDLVPDRTILDGEVIHRDGRPFSNVNPAIVSGDWGVLEFVPFDVILWDGVDVRSRPDLERWHHLHEAGIYRDDLIWSSPSQPFPGPPPKEWEGLIAKKLDAPYHSGRWAGWVKWKNAQEIIATVMGFKPGKGSRSNGIGAILFGIPNPKTGKLIPLGSCSGFSERIRLEMQADTKGFIGREFRLRHHGLQKDGLRHPQWKEWV